MRIIEQTPDRLKTCHYPINSWLISGFCACVVLYTLIRLLVWEPTSTVLNCTRQTDQVTCQLNQKTWVGVQHQQTLENVRSVKIVGGNTSSAIQLVSPTQTLAISNSSSQVETFDDIRAFLNTPSAAPLNRRYDQPTAILFAPLPILIFGGLGLALMFLTSVNTCTFDKTRNQIILKNQGLMEKQALIETYPLSSFQGIEIKEYLLKIGKRYELLLLVKKEKRPFHTIGVKKHSLSGDAILIIALNYEQAARIANTIESFVLGEKSQNLESDHG
jgi:hypothetical protein